MNSQQIQSLLRTLLGTFGGMVMGWFASKGWHLSPDDQKNIIALLQSPEIIGLAMSALTGLLGLIAHTQTNAIGVVAAIADDPKSPVAGIVTTNTPEGKALAASIPSPTIAAANSVGATQISQDSIPPLQPKTP